MRQSKILGMAILLAALSGSTLGLFFALDLPEVRALEDYVPPVMSVVLAGDGSFLDDFARQRRVIVGRERIPTVFIEALIATEDAHFYGHTGVDVVAIARAAWSDLKTRRLTQGASTISMQLARTLFLERSKTLKRKIREVLLALEIERSYTKEEILLLYCNQIYMGHGRYGLEAASRFYFGKPAIEMDLSEAALLAEYGEFGSYFCSSWKPGASALKVP